MSNAQKDNIVPRHHAVKFYGNEASLFTTVAGFLGEGLVAGHPALIIATPEHRKGIEAHLRDRLIDCTRARRRSDLVVLDAEETLSLFMRNGMPDATMFEEHVGELIEEALEGRPQTILRAYGEMVNVLWQQGRPDAAIALEMFWNKLAMKYGFALLCGYAMGQFYKQATQHQTVCDQHTHVLPADPHVVPFARQRKRA